MTTQQPKSFFAPTYTLSGSASLPPSRPSSIFSAQSIDTLVVPDTSYRGFPSEEAYLAALKSWAQSKMFYEAEDSLSGFYGKNTVDDVLAKQGTSRGAPKKTRKSKRRATIAPTRLESVAEQDASTATLSRHGSAGIGGNVDGNATTAEMSTPAAPAEASESKLKRIFTRRKTVA